MARTKNFNAGPAALPIAALELAQRELLDFEHTGMSIIEHSHRGKVYEAVHDEAIALVRTLLGVPSDYRVLLLPGGGSQQFAMIPMNFLRPRETAEFVITGAWASKALAEAKTVGATQVALTTEADGKFRRAPRPEEIAVDPSAAYLHVTSNETIDGVQLFDFPDAGAVPLIADMSSDLFWRPIEVSKFALIYAGAQKNIGPSGVTVVIIRDDLVARGRTDIPKFFRYATHAAENSLYNTPPTFSVYLMRNVLRLLVEGGGLVEVERRNREKADLLYSAIDAQSDFYRCPVERGSRSVMNAVFNLPTAALEDEFVAAATKAGFVGLKGHRSVGGIRVSLYNAVELAWVQALVGFMESFQRGR